METDVSFAVIRQALTERTGIHTESAAVAHAVAAICGVITLQLAPVIGAQALEFLLQRALHQLQVDAALDGATTGIAADGAVPALLAYIAGQNPEKAADSGARFFLRFTELLSHLIGTPLTGRMLAPVWGLPTVRSG